MTKWPLPGAAPKRRPPAFVDRDIPRTRMEAAVRKMVRTESGGGCRLERAAIALLHQAGEDFLLELFKSADAVRMTCKKVGLNEEHFKCAYQLYLDKDEGAR